MVLVLCQLKLCVILPVSMQVHPVNLGKKFLMQHLQTKSSEHCLTIHTTELYKSWLLQAFSEFPFKQWALIRTTNVCLFTKMFLNPGKDAILLILYLFGYCGLTLKVGRIAQRNSMWITLYHYSKEEMRYSSRKTAEEKWQRKERLVMFSSKQSNQSNSQTEKDSNNVTAHLSEVKGRRNIHKITLIRKRG